MSGQLDHRSDGRWNQNFKYFWLAFDADVNGSGQHAAQDLSRRLRERGISARLVSLPEGHDPNSLFVQGGDAQQFQSLLEAARP